MKRTLAEIRRANEDAGYYFFHTKAMRFFNSRVYAGTYGSPEGDRTYFVTSEQFLPFRGIAEPRIYTVRYAEASGDIDTLGGFQTYKTLADTRDEAKRAAAMDKAKVKLDAQATDNLASTK